MSRVCELSKKSVMVGNRVSHAKNRTKVDLYPNLHTKRLYVASEKRFVTMKISAKALKTINRIGLEAYAKKAGVKI